MPGQTTVADRRQALSRFVTYQKVVAVSVELSDRQLSCTISFTELANASLERGSRSRIDLQRTSFNFNWTSPCVRVIHHGKYNHNVITGYLVMRHPDVRLTPQREATESSVLL